MPTTPNYLKVAWLRTSSCAKLSIQECISAISCWMDSNKFMLNADKTEVLIVDTASRVEQLDCGAIKILDTDIAFQKSVKYLLAPFTLT